MVILMDKKTNAVYLLADHPFLNTKLAPIFGKLKLNDSVYLYSQIFVNNIHNLVGLQSNTDIICCLDIIDKEFIPRNFIPKK